MEVGIGRGYRLVRVGWGGGDTLGFGDRSGTHLHRLVDLIARQDRRFLACIRGRLRGRRRL